MKTGSTSSDTGAPCCANGSGSTQVVHMYSKCRVVHCKSFASCTMAVWLNLRAIDESSRSLKAIINRVIISFRDKNAAFARFCNKIDDIYDKNTVFALKLVFQIKK